MALSRTLRSLLLAAVRRRHLTHRADRVPDRARVEDQLVAEFLVRARGLVSLAEDGSRGLHPGSHAGAQRHGARVPVASMTRRARTTRRQAVPHAPVARSCST